MENCCLKLSAAFLEDPQEYFDLLVKVGFSTRACPVLALLQCLCDVRPNQTKPNVHYNLRL